MQKKEKTQAREAALKLLYEWEFNTDTVVNRKNFSSLNEVTQNYMSQLLKGVKENQKKIDGLIEKTSQFWTMKRISLIDLNIMRIAVYEMLYSASPVPFKVCIDEAVEMAKIYGTKDSSKFINGNLDTISKKVKNIKQDDST